MYEDTYIVGRGLYSHTYMVGLHEDTYVVGRGPTHLCVTHTYIDGPTHICVTHTYIDV